MFKNILAALKFGTAGEFALVKGAELARLHGAALHIFHALDYTLQDRAEDNGVLKQTRQDVERNFDARVRPLLGGLENFNFSCLPADPALEVCKMARRVKADLIILGCHQIPEKMCLGRVDYIGMTILEKAPCPVLLVPLCE